MPDRWIWSLDPDGEYTVWGVYRLLTGDNSHHVVEVPDSVWQQHVPLKVSVFVWRMLRNRLPTKENLCIRGIVFRDAQLCVGGCGQRQSVTHLFFGLSVVWFVMASSSPLTVF
jgi:hypothetical protein